MKHFSLDRRLLENFNWSLLLSMTGLGLCGLINLYSISAHADNSGWSWFARQAVFFGSGLAAMAPLMLVDYQHLKRVAWPAYAVSVALLLAVELAGSYSGGAQRWLDLGFIRFQPSEPIKLSLVVLLAAYCSDRDYSGGLGFAELAVPALVILAPFALILKQPDLGTALHMTATCVPLFLILRPRLELLITIGLVAVLGFGFIFGGHWQVLLERGVIKEYHVKRIETFLDPEKDVQGAGWNIIQSKRAVGNGQIFGRGLLQGTQQKNGFLPEPQTDFAFASLAEEWGFVGCLVVLFLFFWLISAGLAVARRSRDIFGGFLALGLSSLIFWQTAINIGMVTGLLPVVGIPLPFISYGGTSMMVSIFSIGIILNVSMRRFMFQDDPVRENPEVWRHQPLEGAKAPATVPIRRLSEYTPAEPDFYPRHRLPHKKPWLKYLKH